MIKCALCDAPIGDSRIYHEVVGFERDRKQGGTNALRVRRRTGRVAHFFCVDREEQKTSALQESLL